MPGFSSIGSAECFLKGSCGYVKPTLGAQEHRRETQIDDVDLLKHSDQVLIMEDGEFEYSGTFQGALENSIIFVLDLQKIKLHSPAP